MKLISSVTILTLLFIPVIKYIHAKTLWKWKTDCMVEYIQKHYPNGCTYKIYWKYNHIDQCWLENDLMLKTSEVKWCGIYDGVVSSIYNIPYCYFTLFAESIWKQ